HETAAGRVDRGQSTAIRPGFTGWELTRIRMSLFESRSKTEESIEPDSTRALSVTAVENDFVAGVYEKLASVYDLTFGPTLHPGRVRAIEQMAIQPEERVLEVGVGTGINLSLYPKACRITGIDFSSSMLEKARERVERARWPQMRLRQMD